MTPLLTRSQSTRLLIKNTLCPPYLDLSLFLFLPVLWLFSLLRVM